MILYIFGVAALGIMLGILTGGSNSPVVATVMPLAFGLLGGAFAFFVTKSDKPLETLLPRFRFLGVTLIVLSSSLIVSGTYAGLVRSGASFLALFAPLRAENHLFSDEQTEDIEKLTKISLLRLYLTNLGLPNGEANRITQNLSIGLIPPVIDHNMLMTVHDGIALALKLRGYVDTILEKTKQAHDISITTSDFDVVRYKLRMAASLGQLALAMEPKNAATTKIIGDFVNQLNGAVSDLKEEHLGDAVRFFDEQSVAAISAAFVTVKTLQTALKTEKSAEIDAALKIVDEKGLKALTENLKAGLSLFAIERPTRQNVDG